MLDRTITLTVEDDEFGEDFDVRVSLDDIRTALEKDAPGWSLHRLDDYDEVACLDCDETGEVVPHDDDTYCDACALGEFDGHTIPCLTCLGVGVLKGIPVPVESGETERAAKEKP